MEFVPQTHGQAFKELVPPRHGQAFKELISQRHGQAFHISRSVVFGRINSSHHQELHFLVVCWGEMVIIFLRTVIY